MAALKAQLDEQQLQSTRSTDINDSNMDITDLTQVNNGHDVQAYNDNISEEKQSEQPDDKLQSQTTTHSTTTQQSANDTTSNDTLSTIDNAIQPTRGLSNAANNVLTSAAHSIADNPTVHNVVDTVITSAEDLSKLISDILADIPDHTLSLAHIGDRITNKTKQSWSKAYKKQFGSLRDFVSSRSNSFKLSDDDKLSIRQPDPPQSQNKVKKKKVCNHQYVVLIRISLMCNSN